MIAATRKLWRPTLSAISAIFRWLRLPALAVFVLVWLWFSFHNPTSPAFGLVFVGAVAVSLGALIRLWCLSYREAAGDRVLLTGGPYGYCRHPRYAANLIMMVGALCELPQPSVAVVPLVIVAMAVTVISHAVTIAGEHNDLVAQYGQNYLGYFQRVPPFLCLRGYQGSPNVLVAERIGWSFARRQLLWIPVAIAIAWFLAGRASVGAAWFSDV